MSARLRATILGCGSSAGVPRIGGDWGRCDPDNARNLRSRASILVSLGGFRLLVDTSPDMHNASHTSIITSTPRGRLNRGLGAIS